MKIPIFILWFLLCAGIGNAQNASYLINARFQNEGELFLHFNEGTSQGWSQLQSMEIMQEGNHNTAQVYGRNVKLRQKGSYQQAHINETSLVPSNMQINVEGQNTYVEVVGSNNILQNTTLNIRGDNRSVIIRNYR